MVNVPEFDANRVKRIRVLKRGPLSYETYGAVSVAVCISGEIVRAPTGFLVFRSIPPGLFLK